jgi:hypothetical protein
VALQEELQGKVIGPHFAIAVSPQQQQQTDEQTLSSRGYGA